MSKKDWELRHIQSLKEEEEKQSNTGNWGEQLEVTYTTEESKQVKKSKNKSNKSEKTYTGKKPSANSSPILSKPTTLKGQAKLLSASTSSDSAEMNVEGGPASSFRSVRSTSKRSTRQNAR